MPKQSSTEIHKQLTAERVRLGQDLDALDAGIRSSVPLLAAGFALVALVTYRKGAMSGIKMLERII